MNRALFITAGIVLIIFVFLAWLYLFLNGSPVNTNQVFSDLGIVTPTERNIDPESSLDTERGTILNLRDGALQQVTTSPVAGYATASTSNGVVLRFMERGTGYIEEVNLNSGLKKQVVPTTIPGAIDVYFSPNLDTLVVISEDTQRAVTLIEITGDTEVTKTGLVRGAENIQFLDDNTIFYTVGDFVKTVGYHYDVKQKATTEVFRVPIPDGTVVITESGNQFIYPKPASKFEGGVYKIDGNALSVMDQKRLGLTAFITDNIKLVSEAIAKTYRSTVLPYELPLDSVALSEKCTLGNEQGHIWCGVSSNAVDDHYVENWYKGTINSDDVIVDIDTLLGITTVVAAPKNDTGRQVDITGLTTDPNHERLFFINKIDSSLWLFGI